MLCHLSRNIFSDHFELLNKFANTLVNASYLYRYLLNYQFQLYHHLPSNNVNQIFHGSYIHSANYHCCFLMCTHATHEHTSEVTNTQTNSSTEKYPKIRMHAHKQIITFSARLNTGTFVVVILYQFLLLLIVLCILLRMLFVVPKCQSIPFQGFVYEL